MSQITATDNAHNLLVSLLDISRGIVGTHNLNRPARRLLELALSSTGFAEGNVYLRNPQRGELVPLAWHVPGAATRPLNIPLTADHPFARVAVTGQPFLLADGNVTGRDGTAGPLMSIVLPLLAGGQVVGILSLSSRRPVYLTNEKIGFLTLAANQMAGTIENARLYEEAVAERSRARAIVNACADGILVVDADHNILDGNPALESLTGFAADELRGRTCTYLLGARDSLDRLVCDTYCPIRHPEDATEREIEAVITGHNGTTLWVGISFGVMRDAEGRVTGAVHTIRDITEHKVAERAILENARRAQDERRRLQAIIDNLPGGVCIAQAPDGEILLANHIAEELLGNPACLAVGGELCPRAHDLLAPDGRPFPHHELPLALSLGGVTCTGVLVDVRQPEGGLTTLLLNSAPLLDGDGQIIGAVAAFQDITQLKETERLKDDFLAMASHELRTPITSIKGYTQMLVNRLSAREGHRDDIRAMRAILTQTDRLVLLVNQMLDVSRLQRGGLELALRPCDLTSLVAEVAERLQPRSDRHRIRFEAEGQVNVQADVGRIERVLVNLLRNAIKFSPQGGNVDVRAYTEGERVIVSVRDSGIGIPPDQLDKIFERFYQARADAPRRWGGLGLGLYISHRIVLSHGGSMWATSEEGVGSTFYFSLPLAQPAAVGDSPDEHPGVNAARPFPDG